MGGFRCSVQGRWNQKDRRSRAHPALARLAQDVSDARREGGRQPASRTGIARPYRSPFDGWCLYRRCRPRIAWRSGKAALAGENEKTQPSGVVTQAHTNRAVSDVLFELITLLQGPDIQGELSQLTAKQLSLKWCSGRDSNPYAFRHTPLKRVCLPIPPPEQNLLKRNAE